MELTIKPRSLQISTYIDVSWPSHYDGKDHAGQVICLGGATISVRSVMMRVITKSSAEAELRGISKLVTKAMWCGYIIEELTLKKTTVQVLEDNTSAITMAVDGRPKSDATKHIRQDILWMHQAISEGHIKVIYCDTKHMLADLLTKALEGELFRGMVVCIATSQGRFYINGNYLVIA